MDITQLLFLLGVVLLAGGVYLVVSKNHVIAVLMGIELIFNAANLNMVGFSRLYPDRTEGLLFALFIIIVAAAEAAVALAVALKAFHTFKTAHLGAYNDAGDE